MGVHSFNVYKEGLGDTRQPLHISFLERTCFGELSLELQDGDDEGDE